MKKYSQEWMQNELQKIEDEMEQEKTILETARFWNQYIGLGGDLGKMKQNFIMQIQSKAMDRTSKLFKEVAEYNKVARFIEVYMGNEGKDE